MILVFVEDFVFIINIESFFEKFLLGGMFLNLLETLLEDALEISFLLLCIECKFFFSVSKVSGKKGYFSLVSMSSFICLSNLFFLRLNIN